MSLSPYVVRFDSGTLVLDGPGQASKVPVHFKWDERVLRWRAPAWAYRHIIKDFIRSRTPYEDQAKGYDKFDFSLRLQTEPRPYQQQAITEWQRRERCGIII